MSVYDTIYLSDSFLDCFDDVLELFDVISDCTIFTSSCRVFWDNNEKALTLDNPVWFNPNSF